MPEPVRPERAGVDADAFRAALSRWASGVTVVTAPGPRGPAGITVSAFSSLSLHPPLVLVCIGQASAAHDALCRAPGFAVHMLREDQQELSARFASRLDDRFAGLEVERGPLGIPLIAGVDGRLVCERHAAHPGGDHTILVGHVLAADVGEGRPLLYWRSGYRRLSEGEVA